MMGQKTALLTAAMNDHTNVVKLLLDRGATILPPHYVSHLSPSLLSIQFCLQLDFFVLQREFKERSVVEETAAA